MALAFGLYGTVASTAHAQAGVQAPPAPAVDLVGQLSSLDPDLLYRGWRARLILGRTVKGKQDGQTLGVVRDLTINGDGQAAFLVVEGPVPRSRSTALALSGVPWRSIELDASSETVRVQAAAPLEPWPAAGIVGQFPITGLLGDYARLRSGTTYGLITDAVFTPEGRLHAVLITRDVSSGGSTLALPFYPTPRKVDPEADSFDLPFVTEGQAREAGLRVELSRFRDAAR